MSFHTLGDVCSAIVPAKALCSPQCWILSLDLAGLSAFFFPFGDWLIWVSIPSRFIYVMRMAWFFLLHGWIISYRMCKAFCFYQFISHWTFRSIPHLAHCEWCCSEHENVDISLTPVFLSIRYRPRRGVWDHIAVLRNSYIIFFNGKTILHTRGPFAPHLQYNHSLSFQQ